jgi:O-antigen ligase
VNERFAFTPRPSAASVRQDPSPGSGSAPESGADAGRTGPDRVGPAGPSTPPPNSEAHTRARARREPKDWAFFFFLAFTAVVFFRPQDQIPGLHLLHLAELSAIGGLTALIFGRLSRNLPVTRITPELVAIFALGLLMIGLAPFSIWFMGSIAVFQDLYSKDMLIFLLMVNVLTSPKRIETLTWLLVVSSGYIGFLSVVDYVRGAHLVGNGRVAGAVNGIFGNPNDLATNMVAVLPLALFIATRPGSLARRLFGLLAAVVMVGATVASGSRAGALGLVAMAMVLVSFAIRTRPQLVFGSALAVMLALPLAPSSYWDRLASITDPSKDETGSREARKQLFRESTAAFLENPLTGVGAGQFKNWNPEGRLQPWHESHDLFLQVAAELGIGGLVIFLFLIARGGLSVLATRKQLRRARYASSPRRKRTPPQGRPVPTLDRGEIEWFDAHSAAMAASLAGWLVCALFASVAYNWTFYYLLALAVSPRDAILARMTTERPSRQRLLQPRFEAVQA